MNEPIFKACTRTAMIAGVPTKPLIVSVGIILLVVVWLNFLFYLPLLSLLILIPHYLVMRFIAKRDDAAFNLLWLKFLCRRKSGRNATFHNAAVYSPIEFKKRGKQ
ncbi:type IV secretion system protein VirB3 [Vibrio ichthyoenteri]|nr:VirB3 family type IV secretion system protein [Vibrio ichthyoenteri]